jgi:hypothetical protein
MRTLLSRSRSCQIGFYSSLSPYRSRVIIEALLQTFNRSTLFNVGRLMQLTSTVIPDDKAALHYNNAVAIAAAATSSVTAAPSTPSTTTSSSLSTTATAVSCGVVEPPLTMSGAWLLIDEYLSPYDPNGERSGDRLRDLNLVWSSSHNMMPSPILTSSTTLPTTLSAATTTETETTSRKLYRFGGHNTIMVDGHPSKGRHWSRNVITIPRWHRDVMSAATMAADRSLPGNYDIIFIISFINLCTFYIIFDNICRIIDLNSYLGRA